MKSAAFGCWMSLLMASATGCVRVAALPSPDGGAGGVAGPTDNGSRLTVACQEASVPRERAAACLTLAGYFDNGVFGLPQDARRAAMLRATAVDTLTASCELGSVEDCTRTASVIGMDLRRGGDSSPVAAESAMWMKRYAEDGCRGGDPSGCALLGVMYEEGLAVSVDPARSTAYYDEACGKGHRRSCLTVAERAEGAAARRAYERACDAGSGFGCAAAAGRQGASAGADPNVAKVVYYARGCNMGDPASCVLGAETYWHEGHRDWRGAASFANNGCQQGIPEACWLLGELYQAGAPRNEAARLWAHGKACEGGLEKACAALRAAKRPSTYVPETGYVDGD